MVLYEHITKPSISVCKDLWQAVQYSTVQFLLNYLYNQSTCDSVHSVRMTFNYE